jgi:hypothetical protein
VSDNSISFPVLTVPGTTIPYSAAERIRVLAQAERVQFFSTIPWQLFTTHTITRPLSLGARRLLFPQYLNTIRSLHRDTVGCLWSAELALGDPLTRVDLHSHCLWVSNKPLDPKMLHREWLKLAGTSGRPFVWQSWDGSPRAIEYALKWADRPDCDWDFTPNLELFMPAPPIPANSQERRRLKSYLERKANMAGSVPDLPKAA